MALSPNARMLRHGWRQMSAIRCASSTTRVSQRTFAMDNPYDRVMEKHRQTSAEEAGEGPLKDFNEINGPNTSKDFLAYVQKSRQVADRPHREAFHEMLFADYGDLVRCDMGSQTAIHVGNAEYIRKASANSQVYFRGGYYYQCYHEKRQRPQCLLSDSHDHYAKIISKYFSDPARSMKHVAPLRDVCQQYFQFFDTHVDEYTKVPDNLTMLTMLWSFESVFWVLFSQSSGGFVDPHCHATRFFNAQRGISKGESGLVRNPLARYLPTPSWSLFCKSLDESYEVIEELLATDKETPSQDSLMAFLRNYSSSDGGALSEEELVVLLNDVLNPAAGFTAPSALWLLHDVSKRDDVQTRILEESRQAKGDLRKCPYLFAVIRESMRLHPLQDAFLLVSAHEFPMGGYRIPEKVGMTCVTGNTALDERYFEEPLEFKPERWLDDEVVEKIHPYASVPYGLDARHCPATSMSDMQLAVLLQETLTRYRMDSDPDEVVEAQYQPLLFPTAPFDIAFNPRKEE